MEPIKKELFEKLTHLVPDEYKKYSLNAENDFYSVEAKTYPNDFQTLPLLIFFFLSSRFGFGKYEKGTLEGCKNPILFSLMNKHLGVLILELDKGIFWPGCIFSCWKRYSFPDEKNKTFLRVEDEIFSTRTIPVALEVNKNYFIPFPNSYENSIKLAFFAELFHMLNTLTQEKYYIPKRLISDEDSVQ